MQVQVVENILKLNDELAGLNRSQLRKAGVFTIDLLGGPGCGKTTLVERTVEVLGRRMKIAVIVGDLTTQRDADRIAKMCPQVVQVNTGKGCHLEAHHVRQAMGKIDFSGVDVLIIENVGNLVCPVGFDLGQDVKVTMFCTTEGVDKPAKYPYAVDAADVVLLNKTDLLAYVPFEIEQFRSDVMRIKPGVEIIECSALKGEGGFGRWISWIETRVAAARGVAVAGA